MAIAFTQNTDETITATKPSGLKVTVTLARLQEIAATLLTFYGEGTPTTTLDYTKEQYGDPPVKADYVREDCSLGPSVVGNITYWFPDDVLFFYHPGHRHELYQYVLTNHLVPIEVTP